MAGFNSAYGVAQTGTAADPKKGESDNKKEEAADADAVKDTDGGDIKKDSTPETEAASPDLVAEAPPAPVASASASASSAPSPKKLTKKQMAAKAKALTAKPSTAKTV